MSRIRPGGKHEESVPESQIDVQAAQHAIAGRLHRTPTFSSATLSKLTGAQVFLKAELFQRTGSFKPRGVLAKLASLSSEDKRRGVISASAGNHAIALAYACALEKIDCLVCMWHGASTTKITAAREYGAQIDLEAAGPAEVVDRLAELQRATGRTLVHGYDDPILSAGHGTIGVEIVEDIPHVDIVVVPAGGGGLIAGIGTAVRARRSDARIVAIEPEGAAALHAGIQAGEPVRIVPNTIADGLNPPIAGRCPIAVAKAIGIEAIGIPDEDIRLGFRFLYERAKLAAELAGAATTGALLRGHLGNIEGATVALVVSGGNIGQAAAADILRAASPLQL